MIELITPKDGGEPFAVLKRDSHLSQWCREAGSLDTDATVKERILPLLKPGDHVIDVGTSIGDHTVQYAKAVGPTGRVYAFEPFLPAYVAMVVNCRNLPQVVPFNLALDAVPSVVMMSNSDNAGSNHVANKLENSVMDALALSVRTAPLSAFPIERLDYIKLDCEGFEPAVIEGALPALKRFRPIIFCEINHGALSRYGKSASDIIAPLYELGYKIEFLDPSHCLAMEQLDVFFIPNKRELHPRETIEKLLA